MGILQKLLGRRADESPPDRRSDDGDTAPAAAPSSEVTASRGTSEDTSSVLGDAAPLPPQPFSADTATESVPDSPPAETSEAADTGVSSAEAPPPVESEPATPSGSADAPHTGDAPASTLTDDTDYFVPERPRRELLDLEPPPPPDEGLRASGNGALPLDVVGSPRAALRDADVSVPHMQKIVQRGDVQLWAFGVRASEALGWWLQIRQVHEQTGWLPVLLGSPDDWLDNGEGVLHEGEDELARLDEVDAKTILEDKAAEAGEPPRGVPILPTRGDSDFAVPKSDGLLGLVQAEHGWQIPALLPWKGSTNWELYGAEHAAVLRAWHEQYEVELVSMTWDILELYVPNPPSADDDVLTAASQIHAYCPDLLAAGVPTLDDLAIHMVRSRAWYFRWA